MINPSVHGWIDKFLSREKAQQSGSFGAIELFYSSVRASGFIYGHVISLLGTPPISRQGWTDNETSKIALLCILFKLHECQGRNSDDFVSDALRYYRALHPSDSLFSKILPEGSASQQLE